jgi:FMN-dependent NADH-azoreductase
LIEELQQADALVLAAPMYNFAVPSQLKAWFDRVARAGVTFRYTEQGSEGLLTGKRAFVFTSRGGLYEGGQGDMVVPYVQQMLNFVGIADIEFIFAKGLNLGDQMRQAGIAQAEAHSDALLAA